MARVWTGLGIVYLVWGSTYLAIMIALRTMPPLLLSSVRFLVAGGILYAFSIRRGDRVADRPGLPQWVAAAAMGGLLLLLGTGGIAWSEQRLDSGVAALVVAVVPLWVALLDWILLGRRLRPVAGVGILIGLGGVALLVGPSGSVDPVGAVVILAASLAWSVGSVISPRLPLPARPFVGAAMQMLAAGVLLAVAGVSSGELSRIQWPSPAGLAALGYLIVIGSLLTYTVYLWLLREAPNQLVSTYAFVNPAVAVALGAVFLGEHVTRTTLAAGGAIVVAVALIVTARSRPEPVVAGERAAPESDPLELAA